MIRQATAADISRLVEMTTRFILTTRYREWLDAAMPERIAAFVALVLEHGVIFVADRVPEVPGPEWQQGAGSRHELVGMIALLVFEHPLTGRLMAEEVAWWVEPEHRNSTVGPRLLHHMERWSVQKRLHMVKMVAPTDSSVGDFYQKQGYQAIETHWLRVFDGPNDRTSDRGSARGRPSRRQEDERPEEAGAADHDGAGPEPGRDE